MCIEVDLTKPLVSKFWVMDWLHHVQYEGLPVICFACGKVGHRDVACPKMIRVTPPAASQAWKENTTSDTPVNHAAGESSLPQLHRCRCLRRMVSGCKFVGDNEIMVRPLIQPDSMICDRQKSLNMESIPVIGGESFFFWEI